MEDEIQAPELPAQETITEPPAQAAVSTPEALVDFKKETERLTQERDGLRAKLGKVEGDLKSLKGSSKQRLDIEAELAKNRRETLERLDELNERFGVLAQAYASGKVEEIPAQLQAIQQRRAQSEAQSTSEREVKSLHNKALEELKLLGDEGQGDERVVEFRARWETAKSVGDLRNALDDLKDIRRDYQEKQRVEKMEKEYIAKLIEAKKKAGVLETPNMPAAGAPGDTSEKQWLKEYGNGEHRLPEDHKKARELLNR